MVTRGDHLGTLQRGRIIFLEANWTATDRTTLLSDDHRHSIRGRQQALHLKIPCSAACASIVHSKPEPALLRHLGRFVGACSIEFSVDGILGRGGVDLCLAMVGSPNLQIETRVRSLNVDESPKHFRSEGEVMPRVCHEP
jgi:hypothetical protein